MSAQRAVTEILAATELLASKQQSWDQTAVATEALVHAVIAVAEALLPKVPR